MDSKPRSIHFGCATRALQSFYSLQSMTSGQMSSMSSFLGVLAFAITILHSLCLKKRTAWYSQVCAGKEVEPCGRAVSLRSLTRRCSYTSVGLTSKHAFSVQKRKRRTYICSHLNDEKDVVLFITLEIALDICSRVRAHHRLQHFLQGTRGFDCGDWSGSVHFYLRYDYLIYNIEEGFNMSMGETRYYMYSTSNVYTMQRFQWSHKLIFIYIFIDVKVSCTPRADVRCHYGHAVVNSSGTSLEAPRHLAGI